MGAGKRRHYCTIRRPKVGQRDEWGQSVAVDEVIAADVPCEIVLLSGRQLEAARSQYATASLRVKLVGDPAWELTTKDYLLTHDHRRLEIGFVDAEGVEFSLLCGEKVK